MYYSTNMQKQNDKFKMIVDVLMLNRSKLTRKARAKLM